MTKFSIIMPYWNRPNYIKWCLYSLFNQKFRDFEIIIIGEKIFESETFFHNGIKVINIEYKGLKTNDLNLGQMMNLAVEQSTGEYLQFWQPDFTVFQNFFLKLNSYIEKYGADVLYVNRVLDITNADGDTYRNDFIVDRPERADHMDSCIHQSKFEPFYEGFYGPYTHWNTEWLVRMWEIKKLKFLYFKDLEIMHAPHHLQDSSTLLYTNPEFKLPLEIQMMEVNLSDELYRKMRYELGLKYELYHTLDEKALEIKNKVIELRRSISLV